MHGEQAGEEREEADQLASVLAALRRRGVAAAPGRPEPLLIPASKRGQRRFYTLLCRYSFRLFLRDVVKHRQSFHVEDLARYCSPAVARRYLQVLRSYRLVVPAGERKLRLCDLQIRSFGATLEWTVAQVLRREFAMSVATDLRLRGVRGGGDLDVVALAEGCLLYAETKSAPPRQITREQVAAFLQRLRTIRPQAAIFLNDTQLRMRDKVVGLFEDVLARGRRPTIRIERVRNETFRAGPHLFITNSDPGLIENLGTCLAEHFRCGGVALPDAI